MDLLNSCEDTWQRYSDTRKRFKQILQLTVRCKAGGNEASLVLELLLGFLFLF